MVSDPGVKDKILWSKVEEAYEAAQADDCNWQIARLEFGDTTISVTRMDELTSLVIGTHNDDNQPELQEVGD